MQQDHAFVAPSRMLWFGRIYGKRQSNQGREQRDTGFQAHASRQPRFADDLRLRVEADAQPPLR
ncbi:MAG: hypothetical protein AAFQ99_04020, partial [Pseudomonadota bacterium]